MPSATLTSKGRVTIPKKVREFLRLEPGDRLDFIMRDDGRVLLQPVNVDVADLKGILRRKGMRAVSVEEMNTVIAKRGGGATGASGGRRKDRRGQGTAPGRN